MRLLTLGLVLACATPANATLYSFTTLSVPGAQPSYFGTQAFAINNSGQVVGTYTSTAGLRGFVFDQASATYTTFDDPASTTGTIAKGINASGQVVGTIPYLSTNPIVLRDPNTGEFTNVPAQAGQINPTATGINDSGQISGYYVDGNSLSPVITGFVRDPTTSTYTSIQDPNSGSQFTPSITLATNINNTGQVVGFFADSNGNNNGFLYDPTIGLYTTLNYPGAIDTYLEGINNSGQVVGFYDNGQATQSFVLDLATGTYASLNDPDGLSTFAQGLNDSGQITGYFTGADGVPRAFLTDPMASVTVSEPTSLAVLGIGIFGLAFWRQRRPGLAEPR